MRRVVLDVETTGLDYAGDDRIIEIGLVELDNRFPTRNDYRSLINPQRTIPDEVVRIHGIDDDAVAGSPIFADIASELCDFIGDAEIVAHNARFDLGFLNMELSRIGRPPIHDARVIDTLAMARDRFPRQKNSLDALCQRFGIDHSSRVLHGALLDARLTAELYLEMTGGRVLAFDFSTASPADRASPTAAEPSRPSGQDRISADVVRHRASQEELARHAEMIQAIDGALWLLE